MIEYFEQSILHDYVAAFENYRTIRINPAFAVSGCGPKNGRAVETLQTWPA